MKRISIVMFIVVLMAVQAALARQSDSIAVHSIFPRSNGSIEIRTNRGDGTTRVYLVLADHENKKEIYSLAILAATLNKSLAVHYEPIDAAMCYEADNCYQVFQAIVPFD